VKIIKLFTWKDPLKIMDIEEPLFEKGERAFQKSTNSKKSQLKIKIGGKGACYQKCRSFLRV
jgi:hypothetical protein